MRFLHAIKNNNKVSMDHWTVQWSTNVNEFNFLDSHSEPNSNIKMTRRKYPNVHFIIWSHFFCQQKTKIIVLFFQYCFLGFEWTNVFTKFKHQNYTLMRPATNVNTFIFSVMSDSLLEALCVLCTGFAWTDVAQSYFIPSIKIIIVRHIIPSR